MKLLKVIFLISLLSGVWGIAFSYPDLYTNSSDIAFSNDTPASNEVVYITATIHNQGDDYSSPLIEYDGPIISYSGIYNNQWYAQSFVAPENFNLAGVSLMITDLTDDDTLTVNIQTDTFSGSHWPSGICLSTKTINVDGEGAQGLVWVDVVFPDVIPLLADTTYWITTQNYSVLLSSGYGWTSDNGRADCSYSIGAYSNNQGNTWFVSSSDRYFKILRSTSIDVAFYDGNPDSGGSLINTTQISPVTSGGTQQAYTTWNSTDGYRNIYVRVDPDNYLIESSTANNTAYKVIYVDFPKLVSASTLDSDSDGMIDGYELLFNEPVDASTLMQTSTCGFSVAGYSGVYVINSSTAPPKIILGFSESGTQDTGLTPELSYSSSTGKMVDIDDGNPLLNIGSPDLTETDGTKPKVASDFSYPSDGALGVNVNVSVQINFPEQMDVAATTQAVSISAIVDKSGQSVSQPVDWTFTQQYDTTTLLHNFVFHPSEYLKNNYTYLVTIATQAADVYGNHLNLSSFTFTTIFSYDESNIAVSRDGKAKVLIQPGTFEKDYYITVNSNPLDDSQNAGYINRANSKLYQDNDPFTFPLESTLIEICGYYSGGEEITGNFSVPAKITLTYEDDGNGNVDQTSPELSEKTLQLFWLDEEHSLWVKLQDSEVDAQNDTVTSFSSHFSIFTLRGAGSTNLTDAYAFPVPFLPSRDDKITFTNLSPLCTIKIYTLNGELIKTIEHEGGEQDYWENIDAASGVYLYIIENDNETKKGKLMIIR